MSRDHTTDHATDPTTTDPTIATRPATTSPPPPHKAGKGGLLIALAMLLGLVALVAMNMR